MKMCLGLLTLLVCGQFSAAQELLYSFPNEKFDGKVLPQRINFVRFSDDSVFLAAWGNYKITLIETKTGKVLWSKPNPKPWNDGCFSPDNKHLALTEKFDAFGVFETNNGRQLRVIEVEGLWQAKYFGQYLAVTSCEHKEVMVLDSLNEFKEIFKVKDNRFYSPELSGLNVKDGKVNGLVIGGGIFTIDQGSLKCTEKFDQKIWAYNHKTDRLLISDGDLWTGGNNWQVKTITKKEKLGTFSFKVGFDSFWCFSPDGQLIALGGTTVETRIYQATSGKMVFSIPPEKDRKVTALAISADGKLAIGSTSGVKIYAIKK